MFPDQGTMILQATLYEEKEKEETKKEREKKKKRKEGREKWASLWRKF